MHLVSHALEVQTGKKVISFDVVIKYYYRILLLSNVAIVLIESMQQYKKYCYHLRRF